MVWHVVLWISLFAVFLGCHDLPLLAVSSFSTVNVGIRRPSGVVGVMSRRSDRNAGVRFLSSSSSTTPESPPPGDVPDEAVLAVILAVAERAARQAGRLIRDHAGGAAISDTKANSKDLLTRIDSLCEHRIRDTVRAAFPTHAFLGEEMVAPGREASAAALDEILAQSHDQYLWIVDPIDGTSNFVHGMPLCMPSVAVAYRGAVVIGVIYDPHRDELFTAQQGHGAFLNGVPITVGTQAELGEAIVAMGSPPAPISLAMSLRALPVLMPHVRTIRMLGSAALMLAWVANGRLTAYWEYDLSCWDLAAGVLLIQEAGGTVTDLTGRPYTLRTRKLCASNGPIHTAVLASLAKAEVV